MSQKQGPYIQLPRHAAQLMFTTIKDYPEFYSIRTHTGTQFHKLNAEARVAFEVIAATVRRQLNDPRVTTQNLFNSWRGMRCRYVQGKDNSRRNWAQELSFLNSFFEAPRKRTMKPKATLDQKAQLDNSGGRTARGDAQLQLQSSGRVQHRPQQRGPLQRDRAREFTPFFVEDILSGRSSVQRSFAAPSVSQIRAQSVVNMRQIVRPSSFRH
ncbi:hypothetical protein L596_019652 [Steinernema carpocapsae]|uniref:MADF domain-containing protein n=1 Tax=Steinernema carpocapsae TaxID=34508 RepID=A0A4U5MR64_STECR|nr:hypothetical protein L596_019652 [Steinernema carpocapsae]